MNENEENFYYEDIVDGINKLLTPTVLAIFKEAGISKQQLKDGIEDTLVPILGNETLDEYCKRYLHFILVDQLNKNFAENIDKKQAKFDEETEIYTEKPKSVYIDDYAEAYENGDFNQMVSISNKYLVVITLASEENFEEHMIPSNRALVYSKYIEGYLKTVNKEFDNIEIEQPEYSDEASEEIEETVETDNTVIKEQNGNDLKLEDDFEDALDETEEIDDEDEVLEELDFEDEEPEAVEIDTVEEDFEEENIQIDVAETDDFEEVENNQVYKKEKEIDTDAILASIDSLDEDSNKKNKKKSKEKKGIDTDSILASIDELENDSEAVKTNKKLSLKDKILGSKKKETEVKKEEAKIEEETATEDIEPIEDDFEEVQEKNNKKVKEKMNITEELDADDYEEFEDTGIDTDHILASIDDLDKEDEEDDEEDMLPGLEDDFEEVEDDVLPGLEDDFEEVEESDELDSEDVEEFDELDSEEEIEETDFIDEDSEDDEDDMLPGLEDDFEEVEDDVLPGLEDDFEEVEESDELDSEDVEEFDELDSEEENDIPDFVDEDSEDDMLPGLEDDFEEVEDDVLPGLEDDFEEVEEADELNSEDVEEFDELDSEEIEEPDFVDEESEDDEEDILPGLEDDFEEVEDDVLPGLEDDFEEVEESDELDSEDVEEFDELDSEEEIEETDFIDEDSEDDEDDMLPGLEDDFEEVEESDELDSEDVEEFDELDSEEIEEPDFVDEESEDDEEDMLPGLEDDFEEVEEADELDSEKEAEVSDFVDEDSEDDDEEIIDPRRNYDLDFEEIYGEIENISEEYLNAHENIKDAKFIEAMGGTNLEDFISTMLYLKEQENIEIVGVFNGVALTTKNLNTVDEIEADYDNKVDEISEDENIIKEKSECISYDDYYNQFIQKDFSEDAINYQNENPEISMILIPQNDATLEAFVEAALYFTSEDLDGIVLKYNDVSIVASEFGTKEKILEEFQNGDKIEATQAEVQEEIESKEESFVHDDSYYKSIAKISKNKTDAYRAKHPEAKKAMIVVPRDSEKSEDFFEAVRYYYSINKNIIAHYNGIMLVAGKYNSKEEMIEAYNKKLSKKTV